jgi:hypothetical protein
LLFLQIVHILPLCCGFVCGSSEYTDKLLSRIGLFKLFEEFMEEHGQWRRALVDALAGAIAGGISRTVTSPLDVIKIRFQVGDEIQTLISDFSIYLQFIV